MLWKKVLNKNLLILELFLEWKALKYKIKIAESEYLLKSGHGYVMYFLKQRESSYYFLLQLLNSVLEGLGICCYQSIHGHFLFYFIFRCFAMFNGF